MTIALKPMKILTWGLQMLILSVRDNMWGTLGLAPRVIPTPQEW